MKKLLRAIFPLLGVLASVSCADGFNIFDGRDDNKIKLSEMECYKSFEEFAYVLPEELPRERELLLPTAPWVVESELPDDFTQNFGIDVAFSRISNGHPEIWLVRRYAYEDIPGIFIYRPLISDWQFISGVVEDTDIFVSEIYQANDGTIWGKNDWEWRNENPVSGSILSKFNEGTKKFEFAQGMLEIPFTDEQRFVSHEIVIDRQGALWILVDDDAIYRYDPIDKITIKQIDLSNIDVGRYSFATGNGIYFENIDFKKLVADDPIFSIYEGRIYQYIPDTRELITVEIPDEPWPIGGFYLTQTGQMWFGAVGYKDLKSDSWYLLHPDPALYFPHAGDIAWGSPRIVLDSSDGLLWFNKSTDIAEIDGTAWYDPETGEGCRFTNYPAEIIEDDQQQLWMFVDGKLYRYSLEG